MSKAKIRVLVVDDHPIVRSGLSTEINLDPNMQVVGEAQDGAEAVAMALQLNPDVILMDLVMPEMDGIEASAEIIQANPDARILILTSFTEEEKIYAAIKAGASGYIFKDRRPDDVLQAIRDVHQGIPLLNPSITRRLARELREQEHQQAEPVGNLTEREMEILKRVAQGALYKEVALEIGVREATVRAHVSSILNKLGLSNRSQLVLYAIQHKLIETPG
ncbi:MAG: response regulator transcription factor [Chloroflexi bacterium]|nr:response regulator transcription factor [Chloroflexota bacterium]